MRKDENGYQVVGRDDGVATLVPYNRTLATRIAKEEQLAFLLRTVRFEGINLDRTTDMEELTHLIFSYADKAGVDFQSLATKDFLERLAFACCQRWGLVIELLIETFTLCKIVGEEVCTKKRFSEAFAKKYSTAEGYSPFTIPDYREYFDQDVLIEALKRKN